jgi:dTDP-4-dehydrorhamnose reductase
MRVLILGAGGMLGHDLLATAPQDLDLFPFARGSLDITDTRAVAAAVADARPKVIINAAAYTAVDQAESESELAFRVNAEAVGELAKVAARAGARVVHFSTDYVFDGTANTPYTEDSLPNPINAYGASKLAGERALQQSGVEHLIVRSQWLFGLKGKSFPRTMWERATKRQPTRVVTDQRGRPTYTVDLARATWKLVGSAVTGRLHVANAGRASWYDIAQRVFAKAGAPAAVTPCRSDEYPTAAQRPIHAVLDTTLMEALLGGPLPPWQDALERFLGELVSPTVTRAASQRPG